MKAWELYQRSFSFAHKIFPFYSQYWEMAGICLAFEPPNGCYRSSFLESCPKYVALYSGYLPFKPWVLNPVFVCSAQWDATNLRLLLHFLPLSLGVNEQNSLSGRVYRKIQLPTTCFLLSGILTTQFCIVLFFSFL